MEDACALVREAHWNQTAADWRIFLELGRVYAMHAPSGRMVATTATLPFGGGFAWISMVLVAAEYRRRGLATQMMRRAMDDLGAAGLKPALDATPAGREVYRALGFEDCLGFPSAGTARAGAGAGEHPAAPAGVIIRPLTDRDWQPLCICDATAFGADRSAVLAALRGRLPPAELVAERDGRIAGFLLGRDGRVAAQAGPLIAEDDAIACALLARALDAFPARSSSISPMPRARCGSGSKRAVLSRSVRSRACSTAARRVSMTRRAPMRWSAPEFG